MSKPSVLFVCSRNSARSQMAEAFLRKLAGDRFDVRSAGVEAAEVHPLTVRVLEEAGIDASGHRATPITEYLGRLPVHYLIIVCAEADRMCPRTFPGAPERLFWPFDDPAAARGSEEERLAEFRRVRDEIQAKVRAWAAARASGDSA